MEMEEEKNHQQVNGCFGIHRSQLTYDSIEKRVETTIVTLHCWNRNCVHKLLFSCLWHGLENE